MASKPDNNIDLVMIGTTKSTPIKPKVTVTMTSTAPPPPVAAATTPTTIIKTTPKTIVTFPSTIVKTTPVIAIAAAGAAITKTIASTPATRTTTAIVQTKLSENRGKVRLHHLHLQNKNAERAGGPYQKSKIAVRTTTPMTAVVLEKSLVTQPPVPPKKLNGGSGVPSNENVLPQKTIDYNSITEEFAEQNETVIDLIMQTQLKTEPITTPEPRKISNYVSSLTSFSLAPSLSYLFVPWLSDRTVHCNLSIM